MDKKLFSLICAIVTSVLWGSAFVAQDMGMDFIGPHTFNVGRFLIGFLTLVPFFFIFEFKNINLKQLDKKKIGIVGLGRIGKKIERYCTAFGAICSFYDPYIKKHSG